MCHKWKMPQDKIIVFRLLILRLNSHEMDFSEKKMGERMSKVSISCIACSLQSVSSLLTFSLIDLMKSTSYTLFSTIMKMRTWTRSTLNTHAAVITKKRRSSLIKWSDSKISVPSGYKCPLSVIPFCRIQLCLLGIL